MKIRQGIKQILKGEIRVSKYNMEEEERFDDSPLRNTLSINLKDFKQKKCDFCNDINVNYCWNCEKPHCKKHAHVIFSPPIINTLCIECFDDLNKQYRGR